MGRAETSLSLQNKAWELFRGLLANEGQNLVWNLTSVKPGSGTAGKEPALTLTCPQIHSSSSHLGGGTQVADEKPAQVNSTLD